MDKNELIVKISGDTSGLRSALMACKACLLVGPAILLGWKSLTACIYAVRVCFFLFPTSPDFV